MQKYRATLRFSELSAADPAAVQRTLEEKLKQAGVEKWRILKIETEGKTASRGATHAVPEFERFERAAAPNIGGVLLVMASAVALWFFWYLSIG